MKHSENSSYREKLIEHLFIGELLKLSWSSDGGNIEISKPEVDNSGYDIIAEAHRVVRHIQLKSSYIGAKTARQNVHLKLSEKPAGCVVWIYFDTDTLDLGPFYFFGSTNGLPMETLEKKPIAKHTKGNKDGVKLDRPNLRVISKGDFKKYETIEELYAALFRLHEDK
jgi:hypothetical protein